MSAPAKDEAEPFAESAGGRRTSSCGASPATAGYKVAIVEDLGSLAAEWDHLRSNFPEPTERFAWTETAAERLERRALAITVSDPQGMTVAIAAFSDQGLWRHITQPGVVDLYEPTDFLYRNPSALEVLAQWIARKRMPICLYRVPADSPTVEAVRRAYRGRGVVQLSEQGQCPYLSLDSSWSNPEDRVSATLRSDLRRAKRKAVRFGEMRFEVHTPHTAEEFSTLFDVALSVENRGWKGKSGSSVIRDRVRYSFYEHYCQRAAEAGQLRILFLRLGDAVAAMQLAVNYDGRLWLLKIGHDARFDECSPGMLLVSEGIGYAARNGLESYEFLGTSSPWTRRWSKQERPMVSMQAYPFDIRGFLLAIAGATRRIKRGMTGRGG